MVNPRAARHLALVVGALLCFFVYMGYRLGSGGGSEQTETPSVPEDQLAVLSPPPVETADGEPLPGPLLTVKDEPPALSPPLVPGDAASLSPPPLPGTAGEGGGSPAPVESPPSLMAGPGSGSDRDSAPPPLLTPSDDPETGIGGENAITGLSNAETPEETDTAAVGGDPGFSGLDGSDGGAGEKTETEPDDAPYFPPPPPFSAPAPSASGRGPELSPPPDFRSGGESLPPLPSEPGIAPGRPAASPPPPPPSVPRPDGGRIGGMDSPDGPRVYIVRSGDTLSRIAARELGSGTLADNIYLMNKDVIASPNELSIGVRLTLPPKIEPRGRPSSPPPEARPGAGEAPERNNPAPVGVSDLPRGWQIYYVQSGDTLSSIALKFYGSSSGWEFLHRINSENIPNPNRLSLGTQLIIPPYGEYPAG